MSKTIKIVFIGGLTNGRIVLEYLTRNKHISVPIAITYPENIDKPRNVDISHIVGIGKFIRDLYANKYIDDIKFFKPEFIFVAGWSGLLSKDLISIPLKGTIGFHPAKLPFDRGRSVLAWQIEEGYTETALTMFYYNELPDCGDIIAQDKIGIEKNDYISDILDKVDDATYNLMRAYFPLLSKGLAPRIPQRLSEGSFRRLRNDKDSSINWNENAITIYNKIRAISRPYPGAIGEIKGIKRRIWRSDIVNNFQYSKNLQSGEIAEELEDNSIIIKCREGFLRIYDYEKI